MEKNVRGEVRSYKTITHDESENQSDAIAQLLNEPELKLDTLYPSNVNQTNHGWRFMGKKVDKSTLIEEMLVNYTTDLRKDPEQIYRREDPYANHQKNRVIP